MDTESKTAEKSIFRVAARTILAGPVALIASIMILLATPLWYPEGPAKIDNLVIPLVLFPLVWSAMFLHACLDRKLVRVATVALVLCFACAGVVAAKFNNLIS